MPPQPAREEVPDNHRAAQAMLERMQAKADAEFEALAASVKTKSA